MGSLKSGALQQAVLNVAKLGDTDVLPLPPENHLFFDRAADVKAALVGLESNFLEQLNTRSPINHTALAPLGYTGFRWVTQIDPLWNAYLLACMTQLAPALEEARLPREAEVVYSHRFEPNPEDGSLFWRGGYQSFLERGDLLAEQHDYVVTLDIADFYGRVYHHRIENELRFIDSTSHLPSHVTRLLQAFSNGNSYGLPVGGPAARIISEAVLNSTDQLLHSMPDSFVFIRYADDYRIFVNSLNDAHRAIGMLSEKLLRNEGLSLQRSKTRILTKHDYLGSRPATEPRPGSAAKFLSLQLHFDPYSPTAEQDYEQLKDQLAEFDVLELLRHELDKGQVNTAVTRRLLATLKHLEEPTKSHAVASLMENVETLAPVFPNVMRAIAQVYDDITDATRTMVTSELTEMIRSGHHIARVETNLAYMLRVLSRDPATAVTRFLVQLLPGVHSHSTGPSPLIQHDLLLILANRGARYALHDMKPSYHTSHAWVKRAFLMSSYFLGDEGRHWRQSVSASLDAFDVLVRDWMGQRVQDNGWSIPL